MKIILSFMFIITFNIQLYSISYQRHDKLEEKNISRLVTKFFESCRAKNFKEASKLTIGKEQLIYLSILKQIKRKGGLIPTDVKKYFDRLRGFEVEVVEISETGEHAIAICTYKFKYFDLKSKDVIRKDREVHYYLTKVDGEWKINFSKLKGVKYFYKSKIRRRKLIRY